MVKKEKSFLENAMPDMDMCFLLLVCFIIVATIAVLCMSKKNVSEKYELNCKKNFCKATRPVARKTCPNLEQLHKEYISGQNTENSNLVRQPMPKWPWDKQYSGECKAWSEGVGDYNARGAVMPVVESYDDDSIITRDQQKRAVARGECMMATDKINCEAKTPDNTSGCKWDDKMKTCHPDFCQPPFTSCSAAGCDDSPTCVGPNCCHGDCCVNAHGTGVRFCLCHP